MKDWWSNLQSREQNLVLLTVIASIIFLFYTFAWSPLQSARDMKKVQVENNQDLLAWMTAKSAEVKQIKLTNPRALKSDNKRSLLAIVDSMANQLGLRGSIKQIEPNGPHDVSIWMDAINFDSLMMMLGELEKRSNVIVNEANISKLEQAGMVKARILLKRK